MAFNKDDMSALVNSNQSNTKKAEDALLYASDYLNSSNREIANNFSQYYQHLADNEFAAEQADLAYERSKATNQVELLMDAGMTRQAALATLNQGGAASAAAPSGSFQPTSNYSPLSESTDALTAFSSIGSGLLGMVGQCAALPAQFSSLQLLNKRNQNYLEALNVKNDFSKRLNAARSLYPDEFVGRNMSLDEARRQYLSNLSRYIDATSKGEDFESKTPGIDYIFGSDGGFGLISQDPDSSFINRTMNLSSDAIGALDEVWNSQYNTKGYSQTEDDRDVYRDSLRSTYRVQLYNEIQQQLPAIKSFFASQAFQLYNGVEVRANDFGVTVYDSNYNAVNPINDPFGYYTDGLSLMDKVSSNGKIDVNKLNRFVRGKIDEMYIDFNSAEMMSDPDAVAKVREKYFYDLETQVALSLIQSTISSDQRDMVANSPNFQSYLGFCNLMDMFDGYKPIEIGTDLIGDFAGGIKSIIKQLTARKPSTKPKPKNGKNGKEVVNKLKNLFNKD